jgi:hypothetical protein
MLELHKGKTQIYTLNDEGTDKLNCGQVIATKVE